ncbi:hypothetical protein SAMD00019534_024380 [Acytostelium subglobosum LB1]|uniref:hypothetical protein n=1 Tax=Acytostelium subglobosum LB1 TaxID=1410327 RepID=UPI000644E659|nr:hypothetical protein SAMD00019534_024380 [Acytostelium subglobosum LB1]GAM19263.1 hypothetical protein SAMD00019534_024380 [Acytostelium subglobosum LB1]|eukprot:XP_012757190.1 hypothetical protein SAMD00019534_024380 [Acytostelium subglobosum LB1]
MNGSEWYLKRLIETGSFRPISGYKETQLYHKSHYPNQEYKGLAKLFTAENWDVDAWMTLCKKVGVTYVILTAKHHDGYCLWPSKTANQWNSVEVGPKLDLVSTFKAAAKRHGLQFGLYYSWSEFEVGCTKEYCDNVVRPQMTELMAHQPDIWWFDGHWSMNTKYSQTMMSNICDQIHKMTPNALINDRIGSKVEFKSPRYLGRSNYRVYDDRALPAKRPPCPWEHINTIGMSWGRNRSQTKEHYKTGQGLFDLYNQVKLLGGRFLLNLGPDCDGQLDPFEVESLLELGKLIGVEAELDPDEPEVTTTTRKSQ